MHSNEYYRALGRQMLGGSIFHPNWLMSLLACAIVSAIRGLFSVNVEVSNNQISFEQAVVILGSAVIALTVSIFVIGPLRIGRTGLFLRSYRTGEVKLEELFLPFKSYLQNLALSLVRGIFVLLWSILFIVPGIVKAYSYALAFYIQQDNPDREWQYCIKESRRLMDGYKAQYFKLHLSFIGWILLSILTCGIGFLWVTPYIYAANTAFYVERKYIDDVERGVIVLDSGDVGAAEQN